MADGGEPGDDSRDEGKHTGRNDLHFFTSNMHQIVSRLGLRLNCEFLKDLIFTARRYAGAVHAVVVCPSVCLSVCPFVRQTVVVSKRLDKSSWFLARRLPSTIPTLCYKEIGVSPKIKVLPSGTLSQTPDVENFATASRSRCQQNSSSSSTVELVDDTYTTVDESLLFTTSRSTVTL